MGGYGTGGYGEGGYGTGSGSSGGGGSSSSGTKTGVFRQLRGPVGKVDKQGNVHFTPEMMRYMQDLHAKTFQSLDRRGIVTTTGADFSRSYTNKHLDNIPDGTTYARPRSGVMVNGIIPLSYGKNLCPNSGFEENVLGVPVNTNIAVAGAICDSWVLDVLGPYQFVQRSNSPADANSGLYSVKIQLTPNAVIPDGSNTETHVVSTAKIPIVIGDLVRVKAPVTAFTSLALPTGVVFNNSVGLLFYDATDAFLGILLSSFAGLNFSHYVVQGSLQVPATMGGGVPAYARAFLNSNITNSSGAALNVGSDTYSALFDDIRIVLQSTADELTPLSTSYVFASNPCTGVTGASANHAKINVASATARFGHGPVTYQGQTPALQNLNDSATYYVYCVDPTYAGGNVTYLATTDPLIANSNDGIVVFGKVTTPAFGGGNTTGKGGGNGPATAARLATL